MRVFVYEYVCGGAMKEAAPSLRAEGWAMLCAVLEDLCAVRRTEVATLLDPTTAGTREWPKNLTICTGRAKTEQKDIRDLARAADFTMLIAPEFQDILATRCQWVEEVGGQLLGPSSAAVRLTADKLRLAEHLYAAGLPTPTTVSCTPKAAALGFPLVVKPREGAGSQATFLVRDEAELRTCSKRAKSEGWQDELVAQPFVPGIPVSVALLTGPGGKFCLKPVWQQLSDDGRFRYQGGALPLPQALTSAARAAAVRVLTAVEGLRGWCGVDLVVHGKEASIVEINPRLTTSYIGLRRLSKYNLMETLLAAASADTSPIIDWRDTTVTFLADGTITEGDTSYLKKLH